MSDDFSEDKMQCGVAKMLRYRRLDCIWFAVPNGGKRRPREMNKLKAMGVLPGVGDLVFMKSDFTGFIELKKANGKQHDEQKDFEANCKRHGIQYTVIQTDDQNDMNAMVLGTLKGWGIS